MSDMVVEGYRYIALYQEGLKIASDMARDDSSAAVEPLLEALRAYNSTNCSPPKSDGELWQIAYRCMRETARRAGGEQSIRESVLKRLSRHFVILEECIGTHWSGKRIRIDAIITPKDDSHWKTKSPKLGIEFKNFRGFNPSFDLKDYTRWWAQCHDYAETEFDGHGYVPVFSYNGFSHYRQRMGNNSAAAFAVRFWGRLGVGEIRPDDLLFVMNGTNKIWSERRGVIDGSRISMERKFGSR